MWGWRKPLDSRCLQIHKRLERKPSLQGREVAPALPYYDLKLVMEAPQAVVVIVVRTHVFHSLITRYPSLPMFNKF